jgi:hypothetical protein
LDVEEVLLLSNLATTSQPLPPEALNVPPQPAAVATTKNDPSGEYSTSLMIVSNLGEHLDWNKVVYQGESVADAPLMSSCAIWDRATPLTVVKLPTATSLVLAGLLEICSTLVRSEG